jgi:ABC-2 type transport system permease protein/lipopolysaccharide transport system permease protein
MTSRLLNFDSSRDKGLWDLHAAIQRRDEWLVLAMHDIRQRYRRSALGPIWITLVMAFQIMGIALIYTTVFAQELTTYLPYLSAGFTVWALIIGLLVDGTICFINASVRIRTIIGPISTNLFRLVVQHLIIFLHNFVIVIIVFTIFLYNPGWQVVLMLPGLVLMLANLAWIVLLLAIFATRYRDIPLMVSSLAVFFFLVTPVMWRPGMVGTASPLLAFNPFYYLLELVRGPLIGEPLGLSIWIGALVTAILGWWVAIAVFDHRYDEIAYLSS